MQNILKRIVVLSAAIILFSTLTGLAFQANEKQLKIVIVKSDSLDQYNEAFNGFIETLEEAGIQFQTKIFTLKTGDRQIIDSLTTIGSEKPDAILTIGSKATQEVRKKITNVPVYFTMVLNPEKNGLINSNGSPIASLSGVRLDIPIETQLKLVKQVFSNLKAIGVLYHPQQDSHLFRQCVDEAQKLKIQIVPGEIQTEEDIPSALKEIRSKSNVLLLVSNQYVRNYSSLKYILMYGLSNNFKGSGKRTLLLGINFDTEQQRIVDWKFENL